MKYIIIQDELGGEFAVFCLAPQTHAEMATAWRRDTTRRVVAAGFCEFLSTGHAIVFGRSDSLNLGNRGTQDAAMITAMYLGTVEMARRSDGSSARTPAAHERWTNEHSHNILPGGRAAILPVPAKLVEVGGAS